MMYLLYVKDILHKNVFFPALLQLVYLAISQKQIYHDVLALKYKIINKDICELKN
jgi:hypothetical protein